MGHSFQSLVATEVLEYPWRQRKNEILKVNRKVKQLIHPAKNSFSPPMEGNLDSENFSFWNVESCKRLDSRIQVPLKKNPESSTMNPESTARNPESDTFLDSLTRGSLLHSRF